MYIYEQDPLRKTFLGKADMASCVFFQIPIPININQLLLGAKHLYALIRPYVSISEWQSFAPRSTCIVLEKKYDKTLSYSNL